MFLLDLTHTDEIKIYLKEKKWLSATASIKNISKAGDGNMNYVLRVVTEHDSIILKQSRAYVEKYPQIPAPANRVMNEGHFYQLIAQTDIKEMMPSMIGIDEENNILSLKDLGQSADYTFLYNGLEPLTQEEVGNLLHYLHELHKLPMPTTSITNNEMRALNHQHIFNLPFDADNGFNLDALQNGLTAIAAPYKQDGLFLKKVAELGNLYLADGTNLLHGDFYPGSWLKTNEGIKIIDPEFCFHGMREFDIGVLFAHLYLCGHAMPEVGNNRFKQHYPMYVDRQLVNGFAGIEIMRRLIGLAQLPLSLGVDKKREFLHDAYQLIVA